MGKRTTIEADKQPTDSEIRIPDKQTIKVFNSTFDDVKSTVDEANKDLKESATTAKGKHLNISAFKVAKGLFDGFKNAKNDSIASRKLASWLANFDRLREYFELDKHANLQGRMFGTGEIGSKDPPREVDQDGEEDPRPRHLRQPGASAATNPVQELAAKTGAKTQPDPIDNVGRGKPN